MSENEDGEAVIMLSVEEAIELWKFCVPALSIVTGKAEDPYFKKAVLPSVGEVYHWSLLYSVVKPVDVAASVLKLGSGLRVQLTFSTRVAVPCSRCLEETSLAIQAQFSYLYFLRSEKISSEEDFQVLLDSDRWPESLDLAPQIWESFILSLPPKVLCSPDCKGLCPNCGQNLNAGRCSCKEEEEDPRLAVLKLYKETF